MSSSTQPNVYETYARISVTPSVSLSGMTLNTPSSCMTLPGSASPAIS